MDGKDCEQNSRGQDLCIISFFPSLGQGFTAKGSFKARNSNFFSFNVFLLIYVNSRQICYSLVYSPNGHNSWKPRVQCEFPTWVSETQPLSHHLLPLGVCIILKLEFGEDLGVKSQALSFGMYSGISTTLPNACSKEQISKPNQLPNPLKKKKKQNREWCPERISETIHIADMHKLVSQMGRGNKPVSHRKIFHTGMCEYPSTNVPS